jgi:hypothetical protein
LRIIQSKFKSSPAFAEPAEESCTADEDFTGFA